MSVFRGIARILGSLTLALMAGGMARADFVVSATVGTSDIEYDVGTQSGTTLSGEVKVSGSLDPPPDPLHPPPPGGTAMATALIFRVIEQIGLSEFSRPSFGLQADASYGASSYIGAYKATA